MANNEGRERWDIIVSKARAEELAAEYESDEYREAKDIFIDVMAEQEQDE